MWGFEARSRISLQDARLPAEFSVQTVSSMTIFRGSGVAVAESLMKMQRSLMNKKLTLFE